jgi:hypothetical protein
VAVGAAREERRGGRRSAAAMDGCWSGGWPWTTSGVESSARSEMKSVWYQNLAFYASHTILCFLVKQFCENIFLIRSIY